MFKRPGKLLPNYCSGFYISFLDLGVSLLSVSLRFCGQTNGYVYPRTSNETMHSMILSIVLCIYLVFLRTCSGKRSVLINVSSC